MAEANRGQYLLLGCECFYMQSSFKTQSLKSGPRQNGLSLHSHCPSVHLKEDLLLFLFTLLDFLEKSNLSCSLEYGLPLVCNIIVQCIYGY